MSKPEQLSSEQVLLLSDLLSKITTTMSTKSFAQCRAKFNGERCYNKVEEFVTSISVFKKIEKISDDDALEGLSLVLTDKAATWWIGIKSEIKKWSQAIDAIRCAFAPRKQPHEIYMEVFAKKQGNENIDDFVCEKRALLAQLPTKRQKEEEHLDMVYGLLKISYKKEIARSDIKTFADLLERGRHLESLAKEGEETTKFTTERKPIRRCCCGKKGHTLEECRKRLADNKTTSTNIKPQNKLACYGCGTPGVVRSNCVTCKNQETPPKPVAFCTMQATLESNAKIPTIPISIKGETGYAYIDTAARTSIAGTQLYKKLIRHGTSFVERSADITLADGTIKTTTLLTAIVDVVIGERILPIAFSAIPEAKNNRTLLGIDFLESSGIVLNLPQRAWYFVDDPDKIFTILQLKNENIPLIATKSIDFNMESNTSLDVIQTTKLDNKNEEETLPDFIKWARELNMVSPMMETPSPVRDEDGSPGNKNPDGFFKNWTRHRAQYVQENQLMIILVLILALTM
ncbi:hypothetical protein HW555_011862 [Spodoptera exigua]|uniref:Uncharacterized protein n=1 Tax=Spodoptera exigua TaxID=7107 RepID=A0A835L467_SPOEX|nr:hypothetical protein HW555_011862 [Spodoptera exigua]